jgi:hypothetical protein
MRKSSWGRNGKTCSSPVVDHHCPCTFFSVGTSTTRHLTGYFVDSAHFSSALRVQGILGLSFPHYDRPFQPTRSFRPPSFQCATFDLPFAILLFFSSPLFGLPPLLTFPFPRGRFPAKMRPSLLGWSLFSLLAVPAWASVSGSDGARLFKRGWSSWSQPGDPTKFNGLEVPPIKEVTQDNFQELIKDGNW